MAHCDFIFCAIQILLLTYLLTYNAHRSDSRENLEILSESRRVYVQKWHLLYKTSDLKRSDLEIELPQSAYRNSCTAYRLVTNPLI